MKNTKRKIKRKIKKKTIGKMNKNPFDEGLMRAHGSKKKFNGIIDVPFSQYKSKGTRSTLGKIMFHYQEYRNINNFFKHEKLNINIKSEVNLDNDMIHIVAIKKKVHIHIFPELNFNKSYVLITINIVTEQGNHANIAFVNNKNSTIEFYEPHGYRSNKNSEISNVKGIYRKKLNLLRSEFKKVLPSHTLVDASVFNKKTSFQTKLDPDSHSGFCVVWCILFIHYRLLNLNILPSKLIKHIDKTMTTTKLLKYAKHVEDIIKLKI